MSEPIRNKRLDFPPTAPTPQNTPASAASTFSRAQQPGLSSLKEEDAERAAASVLAGNPRLVSMIQNKLSGLVGQSSGYIESLPGPVRKRVAGLKGVQKEHAKLEAEFQEQVLELEKKFLKKFTPLYEKRAAIVNGKAEPTAEEIEAGEAEDENEDEDKDTKTEATDAAAKSVPKSEAEADDKADMVGIPEFWLSAMKNHPSLSELITDADDEALRALTDIRIEYLDKPGFRLVFDFADNEFFTNKTLSKTYYYQEETGYGGEFIYDHADGDKILWKSGKDLTVKIETKKQRNKNTKQTRVVKRSVPCDSFFNFFAPPQPPAEDDEEEIVDDVEERLELDYSIGEDIKEKLIPKAVHWFTGEALQYEAFGEGFDEEEDDFEDEDDEDDDDLTEGRDDDDDSDEDVDGPHSQKQDAAECKQS